jgi:hypothetical protein
MRLGVEEIRDLHESGESEQGSDGKRAEHFLFLDFREYVTTTGVNSEKKEEIRFKKEKRVNQS